MKKIFIKLSLFVLGVFLVLSPFGVFLLYANTQKHVYSKTYYAALVDKTNYLKSLKKEKKIVLIGGSNVAFGFDSELLENEFNDYKVVNYGLYAMLGTKIMMDLAIDSINEGDLVFVIPEINEQSMSLYFNASATLKAIEDDFSILNKIDSNNRNSVYAEYFNFVSERGKYKEIIEPGETVYRRDSFNKYGDISYAFADKNIMMLHYDPTMKVDFNLKINDEFACYVNAFARRVEKKKATCFYTWSPVNNLSADNSGLDDFYWNVRKALNMHVVGNPEEFIFDNHYFYDSNFHLNNSGAKLRTLRFIETFNRDILNTYISKENEYPSTPEYETENIDVSINSETADMFNYDEIEGKLEIASIKNEYKDVNEILLPSVVNHMVVAGIKEESFKDSNVNSIIIPETIKYIKDGAFKDSNVISVKILSNKPSSINVSWVGGLLEGAKEEIVIYVPDESLLEFKNDYYWGAYRDNMKGY